VILVAQNQSHLITEIRWHKEWTSTSNLTWEPENHFTWENSSPGFSTAREIWDPFKEVYSLRSYKGFFLSYTGIHSLQRSCGICLLANTTV